MKKYFLLAITYLAFFSTSITANEGFYLKGSSGANWLDSANDNCEIGYVVTGSAGYKFCNGFSLEGEYGYYKNKKKFKTTLFTGPEYFDVPEASSLSTQTFLLRVLYDFPFNFYNIKPYAGWGVGYAWGTATKKYDKKNSGFAWDIIGGLAYPVGKKFEIDLETRYLHTKWNTGDVSLCAGLKYYLN